MTDITVRPDELVAGDKILSIASDEEDSSLLIRVSRPGIGYCRFCGEYIVLREMSWEADGLIGRENYSNQAVRLACERNPEGKHLP